MNDSTSKADIIQLMKRDDMIAFLDRRSSIKGIITESFAKVGINIEQVHVGHLSKWGWWISDELLFQDTEARKLTKAVSEAALNLYAALANARHYSRIDELDDEDNGDVGGDHKINICSNIFEFKSDADEMAAGVLLIAMRADEALNTGLVHKKGQPPLTAYYAFIKDFYEVFKSYSSSVGYYKANSGAEGPFVDVITHAQAILPRRMRLAVRSTIGNRVLTALR